MQYSMDIYITKSEKMQLTSSGHAHAVMRKDAKEHYKH